MPGLGTIINVISILAGGACGFLFGRFITVKIQKSLMIVMGICTIFIAAEGVLSKMLKIGADGSLEAGGHMMLLFCLMIGTLIGEILDIDGMLTRFGEFMKEKTHSSGDQLFVAGFVNTTLTVGVGAMAIMGAIEDGLFGDHSILIAKSTLDFLMVMIMTSVMGRGCVFSAIPVGIFQGLMTVFAQLISPVFTEAALSNISLTGSVLILLVGVNIIRPESVKVSNMLPSIVLAVVWAYMPWAG